MFLQVFSLLVLIILAVVAVAAWGILGWMPGRIAKQRNHPHADAIGVCGWFGVATMGLLLPVAFIWAYSNPRWREECVSGATQTKGDEAA
jgi:uncharacterized membrane protein